MYEGIKCCGLGLTADVHLRDVKAEIKHERQTLRTRTCRADVLEDSHTEDCLIGQK